MADLVIIEEQLWQSYLERREAKMTKVGDFTIDGAKILLLSTIAAFSFQRVELWESHIHGRGVFAKVGIKNGDLATFYPGDVSDGVAATESSVFVPSERRSGVGLFTVTTTTLWHWMIVTPSSAILISVMMQTISATLSTTEPPMIREPLQARAQKSITKRNPRRRQIATSAPSGGYTWP